VTLAAGSKLGPYEILGQIGAGGMGEVYRAKDPRLGRDVAIKVLPEALKEDDEALTRFEREARAIAALSHPNILAIHDFGNEGGVSYSVTELLEGETLRMALARGPLASRQAFEIGAAVAEGLSAAHSRGIVHRDVKPDNIFLTSHGAVKILDFGLVRHNDPAWRGADTASPTVGGTTPGIVLGTLGYMSPEQARGDRADARTDIFALGCVLYEMLTGRRAFGGATAAETFAAVLRDEPAALTGASGAVPAEAVSILRHCLEKSPEQRYQTARDLAFALRELVSGPSRAASTGVAPEGVMDSLAVLPFENAGHDADLEYLSEGIAESLTRAFSRLPGLRVISRSAVARYRGREVDPAQAGRELSVRAVLTGRVLARGGRLSISAELVDAHDNRQIWGQGYQRTLDDIFSLQEQLAAEIAEHLRPALVAPSPAAPVAAHAPKAEAYQLYLKGRYWWNRRPEDGFLDALDYFQKSIEADPSFALSYSGLADCYITLGSWESGILPPNEAFLKARTLARKALELDDRSAESHASLGYSIFHYDWDFEQAEQEIQRAIALNPGYAAAHHWYSHLLLPRGRIEKSMTESLAAVAIDPLDFIMNAHLAWHYYFAGDYDQAIEAAAKPIVSSHFWSPFFSGLAYEQKNMLAEAIDHLEQAVARSPDSTYPVAALAHARALAGDTGRASRMLADLRDLSQRRFVPSYDLAIIHLGLGEADEALNLLERAFDERSSWLIHLDVDPRLAPLRDDRRFLDLVGRVGLRA
jgi:serine/threonine protein kinase/Tfp pilus assembly protein PilF